MDPPPLSSLPPSLETAPAAVHRYIAAERILPSDPLRHTVPLLLPSNPLPLLPMRLSQVRLLRDGTNSSELVGRCERSGLRSKPNRCQPNDYVEEPVRDRTDGKPVPSSSSETSNTRTSHSVVSDSDSKASEVDLKTKDTIDDGQCKNSIFCPHCKLCRCAKCTEKHSLPAIQCCRSRQCLPEDLIDCCSCLWCAKAAYRRCSDYSEDSLEGSTLVSSEAMCGCSGPVTTCCRRWTLLATLALCLPCVCLFWPMRLMLSACSACYDFRRRGCRCSVDPRGSRTLEALLISDDPLSSNSSSTMD